MLRLQARRHYRIAALACTALIAGCAFTAQYGAAPRVPVGSELVVHERLPRVDGDARVFIQGGEVVARSDVDRFRVACAISLHRRGQETLDEAIQPGRFIVIEASRSWARPRPGSADDHEFIDPPSRLDYFTEMEIRSDLQPQVDRLRCRYNGHRTTDEAPGPAEIRDVLGEVATLTLPDEQD